MNSQELLLKYLPPHKILHEEIDHLSFGEMKASVGGIAVSFSEEDIVFGSALSFTGDALRFAIYECLERFVITRNKPALEKGKRTVFSLSNGVALHETVQLAKESAFIELIERNEILKSWYLNAPIQKLPLNVLGELNDSLAKEYELSAYEFSNYLGVSVIGIFAFPKSIGKVFIAGFGAGRNSDLALTKSLKEFCSRYYFLQEIDHQEKVEFSATPDFHQDFYIFKDNFELIRNWLHEASVSKSFPRYYQGGDISFENISPESWGGSLHVFRALGTEVIPLFFGRVPEDNFNFTHRCDIPHPVF